ncbi:hypothetical protein L1987_61761 [Smallanthus sonchifolius]|uniref:Uncharacterized protein n=1 Tax=Smallanthus sonchifolius TaxID=185202 RepID=A0ACB9C8N2_9ASTR|nr:hypothetical protein L1987_61761 [Smallanthus sonchifolius]
MPNCMFSYELKAVKAVDAYGFELCSMAHDYELDTLVCIVSEYLASQRHLLKRLRLKEEAFSRANKTKDKKHPKSGVEIEQEWDQIYTLCNQIEATAAQHNGRTTVKELENVKTEEVEHNVEKDDKKKQKGGNSSEVVRRGCFDWFCVLQSKLQQV